MLNLYVKIMYKLISIENERDYNKGIRELSYSF